MAPIRASEIGEYLFCRRAWWLHHVQGYTSANVRELAAGTETHVTHGRLVWAAGVLRVLAVLAFLAALIAFFWSGR